MRSIVGLLLLLNLAAWLVWGSPPLPGDAADGAAGEAPPPVATGVPELRLLDERSSPAAGRETAAEAPPDREPPRSGPPAICYTLGALPDRLLAERVQAQLAEASFSVRLRIEEQRGDLAGYWVLLPPQPSLGEARARVDDLQQHGIDSFVVTEGGMRNAVSLGYFPARSTAEQLQRQLAGYGYEAQLVLRYAQEAVHWLDLDEEGSERFDDTAWRRISGAYPMLGRYVRDCV